MSLLFSSFDLEENGNTSYRLVSAEEENEIEITGHVLPSSTSSYDHDAHSEDDSYMPQNSLKRPEECFQYNDINQDHYLQRCMPGYEYDVKFIRNSFLARDRKKMLQNAKLSKPRETESSPKYDDRAALKAKFLPLQIYDSPRRLEPSYATQSISSVEDLPRTLPYTCPPEHPPTHVFAILYDFKMMALFVPFHAPILVASCNYLPRMLPGCTETDEVGRLNLPVVLLEVPQPNCFLAIMESLYLDTIQPLADFIRQPPPTSPILRPQTTLRRAKKGTRDFPVKIEPNEDEIYNIWENVKWLGIADQKYWSWMEAERDALTDQAEMDELDDEMELEEMSYGYVDGSLEKKKKSSKTRETYDLTLI